MPARVLPTAANPSSAPMDAAAAAPKRQHTSELTICISLASLFDFEQSGIISHENWQKGMATLMLEELGADPKIWSKLVDMHGGRDGGTTHLHAQHLKDVVPIDPRVSVLLNAIVKGLVGMRDFVKRSLRKEEKEVDLKRSRAVLNIRRKICEPVLHAWRDLMRAHQRLLKRSVRHCFHANLAKGWRTWRELIIENRQAAVEQRKQERKMSRIKSAAGRMANAKLAAGWNSWVELWEERVKARKVSER
jgi:hypothetical protein